MEPVWTRGKRGASKGGRLVHPPARAHRVLDARRCRPRRRAWSPRRRPTASRRSASPTTATCTGSSTSTRPPSDNGRQADHRHRSCTWPTSTAPSDRRAGAAWTTPGGDAEGGARLYYHLTAARRDQHRLPQPDPAREPGLPRGLLLQAQGRLGAARAPTTRASSPRPAASAATCCSRCCRATSGGALAEGGPAAGHLRPRQPLRRAAGPRHPRPAPHQPAAARDRPASSARPLLATNDSHYTHRERPRGPRRAAVRADRVADERPGALQVRRRRALPEDGGRDAPPVPRACPRRATTRCGSPSGPTSRSSSASRSCPNFPLPEGFADDADYLAPPHARGRPPSGGATPCPTRSSSGSPTSCRSSPTWGSARTSSSCGT